MPPYTIQPARRRVGEAPLPGVSQTVSATGALGGDVAGAIQQAGQQVQKLGADIQVREEKRTKAAAVLQERKDKAFAEQEFLSFQESRIRYENEAFRAQRGDSVGLLDRTSDWLKKARDASVAKLESGRSKELLIEMLNPEHTKTIIKSGTREAEQFALWDVELKDAIYTNATIQAGQPDSSPTDLVDLEIQAIDALNAKYKGFDAETKKGAVSKGMAEYHTSVINGKLVADLPFAKEYFKKNKQLIPPNEREELRQSIRTENIDQTSKSIAADIDLTVEDKNEWNNAVERKTAKLGEDIKVEVETAAKAILDAKKTDSDAHAAAIKKDEYTTALDGILEAKTAEMRLEIVKGIEDSENRLKALNTAKALSKTEPIQTDNEIYLKLLDDIGAGIYKSRSELLEFVPYLSTAHFNNAINTFETKQREDKTGKKDKDADIKTAVAKDAFSVALGETYDVGDETQNQQFIFAYDKMIDAGITDFDSARKFTSNLFIDGEIRGTIWDTTLTRMEAEAQGRMDEWLPNILTIKQDNGKEMRLIDKALLSRGIVTDDEVLKRLFKKDAILKEPLSAAEDKEYAKKLREANVSPAKGGLLLQRRL